MARPRNHNRRNNLLLFSVNTTLGWSVTKRTNSTAGEANVARGVWRRVVDNRGLLVGYQPVSSGWAPAASGDPSRTSLQVPEMRANAGLLGASRTAHLTEGQRRERIHPKSGRLLSEEDFIERTARLMEIYPQSANFAKVHGRSGDRAVRVYPKMPMKKHLQGSTA